MADKFTRIGLGIGTVALTLGVLALSGTETITSAQNTNGEPGTFSGRRGGRGGPDGFGPGRGPGGRGAGGIGGPVMGLIEPLRMLASQLDLSDAQKGQIQAIVQSHAEEWKALADREQKGRQTLEAAISADQFDELAIRQRSAEVASVDADIAVAAARARGEIVQILTPDQQGRLRERAGQRGRRGGPPRRDNVGRW